MEIYVYVYIYLSVLDQGVLFYEFPPWNAGECVYFFVSVFELVLVLVKGRKGARSDVSPRGKTLCENGNICQYWTREFYIL